MQLWWRNFVRVDLSTLRCLQISLQPEFQPPLPHWTFLWNTATIKIQKKVVEALVERVQQSEKPMILVDAFAARLGINEEINDFARTTGIPVLTSPGGKGIVSDALPNFHGVHFGSAGAQAHQS